MDNQTGAFFRKVDWSAFWTTFLVTFAVYLFTLAPTVTLEDSGELATGPDYMGVPHPPGYPSWTLICWFFQWIFHWVRYYGHPNPAWGIGFASALFGSLACGLQALLVSRSGVDMLRSLKPSSEVLGYSTETLLCWVGGVAGGLLLAFSPVLWSQSTIVEVYALNAFFQILIMVLVYWWMCRPLDDSLLYITAFIFGFGLANHQTLLFVGPALVIAIWFRDRALFRDCMASLCVCVAGYFFWQASHGTSTPSPAELHDKHVNATLGFLFLFSPIVLFFIHRQLMTEWKRTLLIGALSLLGLSFYGFMPFASEQNPPINWGYPRTPEGFVHAITRGQYETITMSDIFGDPGKFMAQLGAYFRDLFQQYTLPISLLGLVPFAFLWKIDRRNRTWLLTSLSAFFCLSIVLISLQNPDMDIQTLFVGRVQFIQSHAVYAIWLGYGLLFALMYAEVLAKRLFGERSEASDKAWLAVTIAAYAALTVLMLLAVHSNQVGRVWTFFWIALAFTLFVIVFGHRTSARVGAAAMAVLLPLVLVLQNAYDEEQIKIVGGAEENGHDFGWQFGNWELQGVDGIRSDFAYKRSPQEFDKLWAGYPNPKYPPPMETNAIFFGGTDPGRFVPTYMIYCAKVRSDVYLITQNALADNTYMNVMRDLYGDTIWIPSLQDSSYAFHEYMEDVRAGHIPPGADVQFENGHVSVQGIQAVMMINGILTQMIFEANKAKHAFYVEESYVIAWMYPYLEPHGLIMKLNHDPLPSLTPEMVKNDHQFWDWYTRRLMGNSKFLRDVVARKTYSKLRAAIAGIYGYRRMFDEAEYAFKQAVELYPLSPEANFRLADIYTQQRRFADARAVIEHFLKEDPGNTKVGDFLKQIREAEKADARRKELEQSFNDRKGDINTALELADLYRRLGMEEQFQGLTMNILNDTNVPANYYLAIAKVYADGRRLDLLGIALEKYLQREPANPSVWIDLAAVQAAEHQNNEAVSSLKKAVEFGGETARDTARKDPRFDSIRESAAFKAVIPAAPSEIPMTIPNMQMF